MYCRWKFFFHVALSLDFLPFSHLLLGHLLLGVDDVKLLMLFDCWLSLYMYMFTTSYLFPLLHVFALTLSTSLHVTSCVSSVHGLVLQLTSYVCLTYWSAFQLGWEIFLKNFGLGLGLFAENFKRLFRHQGSEIRPLFFTGFCSPAPMSKHFFTKLCAAQLDRSTATTAPPPGWPPQP